MGLIKAVQGAASGVLADQWKEFFYCDSLPNDVLMRKGQKRTGSRSSNTKNSDNIISNGSGIAVADGQCMIIVEQGKIVEVCAEPGEFTYDSSTEPSIFAGSLGESIKRTFLSVGRRFTYGGDTGKDQRVYYFNTKEILDNKFGTANPIMFEVVNNKIGMSRTVYVRCNGTYTYVISNPLLFYTKLCGNVEYEFTRDQIDSQLKAEFIDALQPALGAMVELELRPAQLPAKTNELKAAMNNALKQEWIEGRGISIGKITLSPITLTDEDITKIQEMEDAASMGANPFMMAGKMTNATAEAMNTAAGNSAGAMTGFLGMGMVGMGGQGGFGAAQNLYNMGAQQMQQRQSQYPQQSTQGYAPQQAPQSQPTQQSQPSSLRDKYAPPQAQGYAQPQQASQQTASQGESWVCSCGATVNGSNFCPNCGSKKPEPQPAPADSEEWVCSCGAHNMGRFCPNCGAKKPEGAPVYQCDKCGWQPKPGEEIPRFCPNCGDPFNEADVH